MIRSRPLAAVIAVLIAMFWCRHSAAETVLLEGPSGRVSIETVQVDDEPYLPVMELVRKTGLSLDWDPYLRRLVLWHGDEVPVVALEDANHYLVGNKSVYGRLPMRFHEGNLVLPLEVFEDRLAETLGLSFAATPTPTPSARPTAAATQTPSLPAGPVVEGTPAVLPRTPIGQFPLQIVEVPPQALNPDEQTVIVLDPAHGGNDPGVVGSGGIRESDLTFELALLLKRRLEEVLSAKVVLTREQGDGEMGPEQRAFIANREKGDLLISLHFGGSFVDSVRGFSVFFMSEVAEGQSPLTFDAEGNPAGGWATSVAYQWEKAYQPHVMKSARLAELVHRNLSERIAGPDRGLRAGNLALLRSVSMPAVWVEPAVLTNRFDLSQSIDPEFQQQIVEAIFQSLVEYLGQPDRP